MMEPELSGHSCSDPQWTIFRCGWGLQWAIPTAARVTVDHLVLRRWDAERIQTGSFPQLLAQSDLSMLSSSPTSCTSPKPDTDNSDKKVHWASEKRRRASSTDSESKTHLDVSKLPRSRRPSRLTVKYDRGHLQRWLEMEQWVDAQLQELFQVGSLKLPETMDPGRVPIFVGLAWRHLGELEG
ncbi:hypothetical protein U0070_010425 [Myodes glareolus]|uniref:Protein phosphatase 1 regulatory subunit 14 n=1 Tax=Myodes glareolus TaxID=447135 RepID=A0AAW0I759_MYOGA